MSPDPNNTPMSEPLVDGVTAATPGESPNAPGPEGVDDEALGEVLGELGLTAEELSPEETARINQVVQYMHGKLGDATRDYRELYDRVVGLETKVQQPAPTPPPARAEEELISEEELSMLASNPAKFVQGLTAKMNALVDKKLAASIAPLELTTRVNAEATGMDGLYPGWRGALPKIRSAVAADPSLSTLRSAYERAEVLPRLQQENKVLKARLAALGKKENLSGVSAAESRSSGTSPTSAEPVLFKTDMEAILAAVEQVEKRSGATR